ETALAFCEQNGLSAVQAMILGNYAFFLYSIEEYREAQLLLQRAVACDDAAGGTRHRGHLIKSFASASFTLGDSDEAVRLLPIAIHESRWRSNFNALGDVMDTCARWCHKNGFFEEAVTLYAACAGFHKRFPRSLEEQVLFDAEIERACHDVPEELRW